MRDSEQQHYVHIREKEEYSSTSVHQTEAKKNTLLAEGLISVLHEIKKPLSHVYSTNILLENAHGGIKSSQEDARLAQEGFDGKCAKVDAARAELESTLSSIERELHELAEEGTDMEQKQRRIAEIMAMIEERASRIHKSKESRNSANEEANEELRDLTHHQMQESTLEVQVEELKFVLKHWIEVTVIQLSQLFEHSVPADDSFDIGKSVQYHFYNLKKAKEAMKDVGEELHCYLIEQMVIGVRSDISALEERLGSWLAKQELKERKRESADASSATYPASVSLDEGTPTFNGIFSALEQIPEREHREAVQTHIHWMIRRDMPEVLDIESRSFQFSWSEEDFIRCLTQRNCIGMVSEHDERVIGFMVYELHKSLLHILNFAVHPDVRFKSVGTQMVDKLVGKLSQQRRNRLAVEVREGNVPAQIFFRKNDFRATNIIKNMYDDTDEDAYHMEYRWQGFEQEETKKKNRMKRMIG